MILRKVEDLTKWIYNNSKKILIQSKGFKSYILNQGISEDKVIYFPNSTEELYKPLKAKSEIKALIPKAPFIIMFAGNIGEAQDFETIMSAAQLVLQKTNDIHFVILGDGRKREYVEEKVREFGIESNFHLLGSFPVCDMPHFFSCADALLVTLKSSKIFSLTIPSKVQSYLACSKPIIAGLDGEGAKVIEESQSGLVGPAGDAAALANNMLSMFTMESHERESMSFNGREYFEINFEREKLLDRLTEIFSQN